MINDRVRKPKHRRGRSSPRGRLAAWREASSRVASPPPQLEWPSFARDGNCEALGPTADYDGTLGASQRGSLERETFFRFATSRRAFSPQGRVRTEPLAGAPLAPPHERSLVRAPGPGGAPAPSRVFERPVCGRPGLLRRQQAQQKCDRAPLSHTAGGASLAGFRSPYAACVPVARPSLSQICALGRREEYATATALSLQAHSDSSPCGGLSRCHHPQCSRLPRFGRASGTTTFVTVSRLLERPLSLFAVAFNVLSVMPTRSKRVDGSRSLVRRSLS